MCISETPSAAVSSFTNFSEELDGRILYLRRSATAPFGERIVGAQTDSRLIRRDEAAGFINRVVTIIANLASAFVQVLLKEVSPCRRCGKTEFIVLLEVFELFGLWRVCRPGEVD